MGAKIKRLSREYIAEKMAEFEKRAQSSQSQRQLADEIKIPRSTLQYWLERKSSIDVDIEVVNFF